MASLMQEFAEARKQRLQKRADFLVDSQLASESRQEEVQNRSNQMSRHLQDLYIARIARTAQTARIEQATEDSAQRAQDVRTRTFKMRSLLKRIHKARIRTSQADSILRQQFEADRLVTAEADREQRQQFAADRLVTAEAESILRQQQVQERVAFTQMQLEDFTKTRLANATFATQQRLEIESNRRVDAQAFCSNLRDSVWGTSSPSVAVSQAPDEIFAKSSPDISKKSTLKTKIAAQTQEPLVIKPVEAKPLVEVKQTVKEISKEVPKTFGKIEQFVVDYVAQLSTNSSLLEVVNDRDTVRDLLAQGANTLKVDPSDILNTLLQMAEGSAK